jgi:hypothetical protein
MNIRPALLAALASSALVLVGCGGAGMLSDGPDDAALLPEAEAVAADEVAEAVAPEVVTLRETPEPDPEKIAAADAAAAAAARAELEPEAKAAAEAVKARAAAEAARAASAEAAPPPQPEEPVEAAAVAEPEPVAALSAATEAVVPEAEGGGIGVWLVGFLITGAVAGGGWFALQPKWVRRRILRNIRQAPGKLIARFRRSRADADENAKGPAWQTQAPRIVLSSSIIGGPREKVAPDGPSGKKARRPKSITNVTLPAMEAASDGDADPSRN